jgi:hypothetical protein
MLVGDRAGAEVELHPGLDHRARVMDQLAVVESAQRACEHEHRKLDPRIAMAHHVGEHGLKPRVVQTLAANLRAHQIDAARGNRQRRVDRASFRQSEIAEGLIREPDFVGANQRVAAKRQDAGDLAGLAARGIDPHHVCAIERIEAEVSAFDRLLVNRDHVFAESIDLKMPYTEHLDTTSSRDGPARGNAAPPPL